MLKVNIMKKSVVILMMMISIHAFGASLPTSPYGGGGGLGGGEGFSGSGKADPLLGQVDPDAPAMTLGDNCPCTSSDPHNGTGVSCPGHLVVDPGDGDGLTCDNPTCPCGYYVAPGDQTAVFWGFPALAAPLNDELSTLLILSLLYTTWLIIKKRKLLLKKVEA